MKHQFTRVKQKRNPSNKRIIDLVNLELERSSSNFRCIVGIQTT